MFLSFESQAARAYAILNGTPVYHAVLVSAPSLLGGRLNPAAFSELHIGLQLAASSAPEVWRMAIGEATTVPCMLDGNTYTFHSARIRTNILGTISFDPYGPAYTFKLADSSDTVKGITDIYMDTAMLNWLLTSTIAPAVQEVRTWMSSYSRVEATLSARSLRDFFDKGCTIDRLIPYKINGELVLISKDNITSAYIAERIRHYHELGGTEALGKFASNRLYRYKKPEPESTKLQMVRSVAAELLDIKTKIEYTTGVLGVSGIQCAIKIV